jgi:hypothetical protein
MLTCGITICGVSTCGDILFAWSYQTESVSHSTMFFFYNKSASARISLVETIQRTGSSSMRLALWNLDMHAVLLYPVLCLGLGPFGTVWVPWSRFDL